VARSKKPVRSKSRRPETVKRRTGVAPRKRTPIPDSDPGTDFAKPGDMVPVAPRSRFTLAEQARKVLSRSDWNKDRQNQLSDKCFALAAKLKKSCPQLLVDSPLKAGEVSGDIAIGTKDFHAIIAFAAGAKDNPQVVWSDGTNELLVNIADMTVKTTDGLILVKIPVSCEEMGRKSVLVTFATGSPENPAGLLFATDTVPEGPSEIVEIWGEALIALAWTSVLRAVSALADVAGTDQDGAGLVPVGLATSRSGVKLLVMARHEMDRVAK